MRRGPVATWVLFLLGAVHWLLFFGPVRHPWRGPDFHVEDWPKEHHLYTVLQQAVRAGRMPYYASRPIHTRKFLALPEVSWTPDLVLLRFTTVGRFLILHELLCYALGFYGCVLLARRYRLGLLPFAMLTLLFGFNGHVTSHLSVGHSMWAGYFLLPYVFLFLLELVEDGDPRAPHKLALALFGMALLGAFHVFVWCVFLLGLTALNRRRLRRPLATALAWALALCLCRLLPAYFLLNRKDQLFLSGYPDLTTLWQGLETIQSAAAPMRGGLFGELRWWEYDAYVGLSGLALLAYLGVYRPWRAGRALPAGKALEVPLAALAVLSLGDVYAVLNVLGIPLLSAERVSSRFLVLGLVYLTIASAVQMQRMLEAPTSARTRATLAALVVSAAVALGLHSRAWRVPAMHQLVPHVQANLEFGISDPGYEPQNLRERAYVAVCRGSLAASALALGMLAWRARRATSVPAPASR